MLLLFECLREDQSFNKFERKSFRKSQKAFSIIEAFITLIIVALVLMASAPLITTQMKSNQLGSIELAQIKKEIQELKNSTGTPNDAVMFFKSTTCPDGWAKINGFGGYYLRIQNTGETIGAIKEQMVHKHKHISPFSQAISDSAMVNAYRYGPFRSSDSYGDSIVGDGKYEKISLLEGGSNYSPSDDSTIMLTGGSYSADNNNWYVYTSDGMNRYETIKSYSKNYVNILTCPNRDENNICVNGATSFSYDSRGYKVTVNNTPVLSEMPLVGNENRPNSIVLTACVKGYTSCSMSGGNLNCK